MPLCPASCVSSTAVATTLTMLPSPAAAPNASARTGPPTSLPATSLSHEPHAAARGFALACPNAVLINSKLFAWYLSAFGQSPAAQLLLRVELAHTQPSAWHLCPCRNRPHAPPTSCPHERPLPALPCVRSNRCSTPPAACSPPARSASFQLRCPAWRRHAYQVLPPV